MEEYRSPADRRWLRLLVASWALIGLIILLLGVLWVLRKDAPALIPFLFALVTILLLRKPVQRLADRGVPRAAAVGICYLIVTLALVLIGAFLLPPVLNQLSDFIVAFPRLYQRAYKLFLEFQLQYRALRLPVWTEGIIGRLNNTLTAGLGQASTRAASGAIAAGQFTFSLLFDLIIALVVSFYVLKDLPTLREEVLALAGEHRRDEAELVFSKISTTLGGYLRGQLIVSAIVGTLTAIALAILRVPYALVIGMITGLFNVVPYLGPIIGAMIAAIAGAFVSPLLAILAPLAVFGVQQLDGLFISPRIMSEQVDLYPVLVIFSLLTGAALFGFIGLLLAIPIAAIGKGLFVYYFEKHTRSTLKSQEGVLFKMSKEECAEAVAAGHPEECPADLRAQVEAEGEARESKDVSQEPPKDEGGDSEGS